MHLRVQTGSSFTELWIFSFMMRMHFPSYDLKLQGAPGKCPCPQADPGQFGVCDQDSGKRKFKYFQRIAS